LITSPNAHIAAHHPTEETHVLTGVKTKL